MDGQAPEVRLCPSTDCIFYKFRMGKGRPKLKEIREFCYGCGEGTAFAIRNCEFPDCPLFIYRFAKNPSRKGIGGVGAIGNLKNKPQLSKALLKEEVGMT